MYFKMRLLSIMYKLNFKLSNEIFFLKPFTLLWKLRYKILLYYINSLMILKITFIGLAFYIFYF